MRRLLMPLVVLACVARAQATRPDAASAELDALRADLIDSFNHNDMPRLLSHLDAHALVVWQNAEVCHGPADVKAYGDRMMSAPGHYVRVVHADPRVTDRHVLADGWAVSVGDMNDTFELSDGTTLPLNSRFTATTARGPDGRWRVVAFHVSINAFDNPVLRMAARRTAYWTAGIAGGVGLLVGGGAVALLSRRRANRQGVPT